MKSSDTVQDLIHVFYFLFLPIDSSQNALISRKAARSSRTKLALINLDMPSFLVLQKGTTKIKIEETKIHFSSIGSRSGRREKQQFPVSGLEVNSLNKK
jgi:hypothetical protein